MTVFRASFSIGIGDLLLLKAQCDQQVHRFSRVRVSPNWGLLTYRSQDYRPFVEEYFKLLFPSPPYDWALTEDLPFYDVHTLRDAGFPAVHPRLAGVLCAGDPIRPSVPYVVLQTKVRDFPRARWEQSKGQILGTLLGLHPRYSLVLLGEREVEQNTEYAYHGPDIVYSIFSDLKNNLPVHDMTVPRLGITPPSLANLRSDCTVMRDARACIVIGLGGTLCLALAVGNVIGLRGDAHPVLDILYRDQTQPSATLTHDTGQFLAAIKGL